MKLNPASYKDIYAAAMLRSKNAINDERLEILSAHEEMMVEIKIMETYLHALGDAWMGK